MVDRDRAYVVGDFHLGCGDALDDFDQDEAFTRFVDQIAREGTTFFVNGDFVDFVRIPPFVLAESPYLLWTEEVSLEKLKRAAASHSQCFQALGSLLDDGGSVCILVGNHDLDFAWPRVQQHTRELLSPRNPDQLRFTIGAERYHGVHVQHGFHFCAENSPINPEDFIHAWPTEDGTRYLERVWGTDFMLGFFNELEREYPFANNVKPAWRLLYQGIRHRWIGAREIVRLATFVKRRGVPWRALWSGLLAAEQDQSGIDESAAASMVLGAFKDEGWQQAITDALADAQFSRDMVEAVRSLRPESLTVLEQGTPELLEPATELLAEQAPSLGMFREKRDRRAAEDVLGNGITHVVFGHTHEKVDGTEDPTTYFNPGSWLPHLDLRQDYVRKALMGGITRDVLSNPRLYVAERNAVEIIPDEAHAAHVHLIDCT
jgi:UDP-2,3-diacylglucosamine pyrophosphatase LpxH